MNGAFLVWGATITAFKQFGNMSILNPEFPVRGIVGALLMITSVFPTVSLFHSRDMLLRRPTECLYYRRQSIEGHIKSAEMHSFYTVSLAKSCFVSITVKG